MNRLLLMALLIVFQFQNPSFYAVSSLFFTELCLENKSRSIVVLMSCLYGNVNLGQRGLGRVSVELRSLHGYPSDEGM